MSFMTFDDHMAAPLVAQAVVSLIQFKCWGSNFYEEDTDGSICGCAFKH